MKLFSVRKAKYAVLFLGMAVLLTGCSGKNGRLYSKAQVLEKVKEQVTDEKFSLDHVEKDSKSRPKKDIYYFKSEERNFTFTAISTLENIAIVDLTPFYSKSVRSNYNSEVLALYEKEVEDYVSTLPCDDSGYARYLQYDSYDDLEAIAQTLIKADDVYKAELDYNTSEWMKNNPVYSDTLYFTGSDQDGNKYNEARIGFALDGSWTYESLYDYLTYKHIQMAYDDKLEDPTIPEEEMARAHSRFLAPYLNGINVVEDACSTDKANKLNNRSNASDIQTKYHCMYYYNWDCYMMLIDLGLTDEQYAPRVIEYYSDCLLYDAKVGNNTGVVTLDNGIDEWKITSKEEDNTIYSCVFTKNGNKVDIPYITADDSTIVGARYIVGIRVDDFADIFNLKYTLNEADSTVVFEEK